MFQYMIIYTCQEGIGPRKERHMNKMKKDIKDQFSIIRCSMKMIDTSRTREDVRKNQQLLKVWNNTFKFLMDHAESNEDRALALIYYGALGNQVCELVDWNGFKSLVEKLMKGELL